MDINTLMAYLNKTPENTNAAIVKSMVENIVSGEKPTSVWAFFQDMGADFSIGSEIVRPFYDGESAKLYELPTNTEIELFVEDVSENYGTLLINDVEQSVYDKTDSGQIYKVKLTENSVLKYTPGN